MSSFLKYFKKLSDLAKNLYRSHSFSQTRGDAKLKLKISHCMKKFSSPYKVLKLGRLYLQNTSKKAMFISKIFLCEISKNTFPDKKQRSI